MQRKLITAKKMHDLGKLPEPLKRQFEHLCKMAYDGLIKGKLVFSDEELEETLPECTDIGKSTFGLMTAVRAFSKRDKTFHEFVHMNIQDHLGSYTLIWLTSSIL